MKDLNRGSQKFNYKPRLLNMTKNALLSALEK